MVNIGEVVKSARIQQGLSQKEFGKTLTVSQPYISAIENGKEIPTPMFLKLFSIIYSVDKNILNGQS